jgi:hypothetical protein
MVIDTIQKQLFTAADVEPGDYSAFAQQAESLFMPSVLYALDEYGVPVQTTQRLMHSLLPAESLDGVLSALKRLDLNSLDLARFERELLEMVREGI